MNAERTVFASALSVPLEVRKETTESRAGVRVDFFENVIVVIDDVKDGVAPRAAFVAVTKHVPGFVVLNTSPFNVHFDVPPTRRRNDSDPPPGSPDTRSVSGVPTVPVRAVSVSVGTCVVVVVGMVVVVVVLVVVVVVVVAGGGGGGGGGGGEPAVVVVVGMVVVGVVVVDVVVVVVVEVVVVADVNPLPLKVMVCTPLPSFPTMSQLPVTGPLDVGANCTVS
jgi:hypothetical protein